MKTFYIIGSSKCHYTMESIRFLQQRFGAGAELHFIDREKSPAEFKKQFDNVKAKYGHTTMPCVFEYLGPTKKWRFIGGCDDTKRVFR